MPYRRIEHSSKELLIKLYVEGFLTRDEVLAVGVFSNATLHRSLKKWNGTGLPQRLHSTGRPRKLGTEDIAYVLERLDQCADLMLDELASNIRSDLTHGRRIVVTAGLLPDIGRCKRGPASGPNRATLIPGLTIGGIIAPKIYHSTVNADVFYDYLIRHLLPLTMPFPGPGSVIVMDNVPFHRSPKIKQLVRRFGCRIECVAPWSPWLNPIEEAFSKVKASLRRGASALDYDVFEACDAITSTDAQGWIRNAGYL
ncbi:unnamed protein product [Tilletia laevis]|nr:unnamed protein product [Tilletia laevis]